MPAFKAGQSLLRLDEIGATMCDEFSGSSNLSFIWWRTGRVLRRELEVGLEGCRVPHEVVLRHIGSPCCKDAGVTMLSSIKLASARPIGLRCSVTS